MEDDPATLGLAMLSAELRDMSESELRSSLGGGVGGGKSLSLVIEMVRLLLVMDRGNGGTGGGVGDSVADQCPDELAARVVERALLPDISPVDATVFGLRRLLDAESGPIGDGPDDDAVNGECGVLSSYAPRGDLGETASLGE